MLEFNWSWLVQVVFHQATQSNNIPPYPWHVISFWLLLIFVWEAFLFCAHSVRYRWVMLLQALHSVSSKWDGMAASLVNGLSALHVGGIEVLALLMSVSPLPWTFGFSGRGWGTGLNSWTTLCCCCCCCCLLAGIDGWMDNVSGDEVVRALSPALLLWSLMYPRWLCFTVSEILHCLLTYSLLSLSTLYVTGTGLCLLGSPWGLPSLSLFFISCGWGGGCIQEPGLVC